MTVKRGSVPSARSRGGHGIEGTRSLSLAAAALLALTGCDAGTSSSIDATGQVTTGTEYDAGDAPTIARLRVQAPDAEHFFLRGTIPVPPGTVLDDSLQVPFSVISQPAEAYAITQVETVSRYPDPDDGADVVEITAHVRRPFVPPGTPLVYDVVYRPHAPEPFEFTDDVEGVLEAPGALKLTARDPFGHGYSMDLTAERRAGDPGVETIRRGSLVWETLTRGMLLPDEPVAGNEGTLPRLMGVEAFVRSFARQDYFAIDLLVHNAFEGTDPTTDLDDAIRDLYFRDLTLQLPQGWNVVHVHEDPFGGPAEPSGSIASAPIVGPLPGGRMHLMHNQAQFSRRILIARDDALEAARAESSRETIGFCVDGVTDGGAPLWSWWNPETARYMPQNHPLPRLDGMTSRSAIESNYADRYANHSGQVRTGSAGGHPVVSAGLGWAHPYGVAYGGMTGGERIDQIPGVDVAWSASQSAYRYTELRSKMVQERQAFLLHAADGSPSRYEDHVRTEGNPHGSWLPMSMSMTLKSNQTYFFQQDVSFQANYVRANGLEPPYEDALKGYMPIDLQHLIRYSGDLLTLTWLGNDSLAKSQLEKTAELFRMTHHDGYSGTGTFASVSTMRAKKARVEDFPGTGVDYRRGEAWGLFSTAAAYAVGDERLRERLRPWFREVAETIRAGQSQCTGNIMSSFIHGYGDGSMRTRQAFEVAFVANAMESMRTTVFSGVDAETESLLVQSLVDVAYSAISAPYWDDSFGGLRNITAVGSVDGTDPDFCVNLPPDAGYGSTRIENRASMTIWAYGYMLTGDGEFLTKASQAIGMTSNLTAEIGAMGPERLAHSAYLLDLVQGIGGAQ